MEGDEEGEVFARISRLTPFQIKVLQAAEKIPAGETRTYRQVAAEAGHPRAFRAVGTALGKNPVPGFIPCHRVVRSDGSAGGYSGKGGKKGKMRLLLSEGAKIGREK
ncbi:MAG: MGMT family protein [Candidatus ainarchaeum sp.]|nr:MGMT family protein [Candidatus ainarchaeum sp.]